MCVYGRGAGQDIADCPAPPNVASENGIRQFSRLGLAEILDFTAAQYTASASA